MRTTSIGRRRPDPVPWTWEVPALVALLGAGLAVLGMLTARAVAGLLTGAGWAWPTSAQLLPTVGDLLVGRPGVAPAWLVYLLAAVLVAALLSGLAWATWWVWTQMGPGRRDGLATPAEATAVLGTRRLHRARHIIRPDLYRPPRRGRRPRRRQPTRRRAEQANEPASGRGHSGARPWTWAR